MNDQPTRRTKRRYAHELYPPAEEYETRPLTVEVPTLYAHALGLEVHGTDWYDLTRTKTELRLSGLRVVQLVEARRVAFLADALLLGMTGDQAWQWANENTMEESGEIVYGRAVHYGIKPDLIKPYPVLDERQQHEHWSPRDKNGMSFLIEMVAGPESECERCTELVEAVVLE